MTQKHIFVTGGTGFIGRVLLEQLSAVDGLAISVLVRHPPHAKGSGRLLTITGDLTKPESWGEALQGVDTVCHVAAATGKASEEHYRRVNVEGTRALVEGARAAGVGRFLLVSSIAAGYPEKRAYPYARSKEESEQVVRESGLDFTILRPTIVLGEGSPAWSNLASLARLPVMPLFGGEGVRVQPVLVDDVARAIVALIGAERFRGETFDSGGADALTFGELMRRIRTALKGRAGPTLPFPVRPLVGVLALWERFLPPILPASAGQFYAFLHEGTVRSPLPPELGLPPPAGVDAILERLPRDG